MNSISFRCFGKLGRPFCKNLSLIVTGMMRCCSSNSTKIALEMQKDTGLSFKSNEIRFARFLQYKVFQVNDTLWRMYLKLLFGLLNERKSLKEGSKININVDFTTIKDYFLILSASVNIGSRAVPLYFTMRNYPRRQGMLNQKKMEEAFIKGLRHILPKKYRYVVVADRGFGNNRFISLCTSNNFKYVIRLQTDLNVQHKNKIRKLSSIRKNNTDLRKLYVQAWKKNVRVVVRKKNKAFWWLVTDLDRLTIDSIASIYAERFKIEKCFQDQKSSGFDIENSKIRKYDRFKRLLFCVCLAQLFFVFLGDAIHNSKHNIKKNFPLHIELILASFRSDAELVPHSSLFPSE